jgi:hypothetical protein
MHRQISQCHVSFFYYFQPQRERPRTRQNTTRDGTVHLVSFRKENYTPGHRMEQFGYMMLKLQQMKMAMLRLLSFCNDLKKYAQHADLCGNNNDCSFNVYPKEIRSINFCWQLLVATMWQIDLTPYFLTTTHAKSIFLSQILFRLIFFFNYSQSCPVELW